MASSSSFSSSSSDNTRPALCVGLYDTLRRYYVVNQQNNKKRIGLSSKDADDTPNRKNRRLDQYVTEFANCSRILSTSTRTMLEPRSDRLVLCEGKKGTNGVDEEKVETPQEGGTSTEAVPAGGPTDTTTSEINDEQKCNDSSKDDVAGRHDEDADNNDNNDTRRAVPCRSLNLNQEDTKRYQKYEEQERDEMDKIENAKRTVRKDQVELWGVYRYGLQHVLALNDVSDAPDAILPGNY